jgi:hypothetical protein
MPESKSFNFWDDHYARGGTSGDGSVGEHREWKWSVVKQYTVQVDDVVDVACGDLSFWAGRDCMRYTGIDISSTIIERNRKIHPRWQFILANAADPQQAKGRIVFCFDLLFHIMDDNIYTGILQNLTQYSAEWIFIFTWKKNHLTYWKTRVREGYIHLRKLQPLKAARILWGTTTDYRYQTYRDFNQYVPLFESAGFDLHAVHDDSPNPWGAMYVFRKRT